MIRLLNLIEYLHLSGMWFGVDVRTKTQKTKDRLRSLNLLIANIIGRGGGIP